MRKRVSILILIILISLSLVSCQQSLINDVQIGQQENGADYGLNKDDVLDSGPVKGGTLNLFSTKPDTFNPLLTKNFYVSEFLGLIYEGLVRLDKHQKPVPVLSDSWSVSSDGLIWNFHIREGVQWSDGHILTAEDVAFTVECLQNPGIDSVYQSAIQNVATFAAVDTSNLKLVLKKPNSFTPEMMSFPIIPKQTSKSFLAEKDFKPVGTGPYLLGTYDKDKYVTLKENPRWWYLAATENKSTGILYLDKIKIKIFREPNDAISAYLTGDIDTLNMELDEFGKYEGRSDLFLKKYISKDFEFMAFNLYNPVTADLSVRKAIEAAIDKEKIIKEVYDEDAVKSDIPINPDSWIFEEKNSEATLGLKPHDILVEGGWKENDSGYRKSFGGVYKKLELELLVNDNNNRRISIAEKISEQLTNAGIRTTVKKMSWTDMFRLIGQSKFDMVYTGCRISQIPDISFLYSIPYLSSFSPVENSMIMNISGYSSTIVNNLISMIFAENDHSRKKVLYNQLEKEFEKDIPYIGFCFLKNGMIYRKNIRGRIDPFTWNRYYDITGWYKPEAQ